MVHALTHGIIRSVKHVSEVEAGIQAQVSRLERCRAGLEFICQSWNLPEMTKHYIHQILPKPSRNMAYVL